MEKFSAKQVKNNFDKKSVDNYYNNNSNESNYNFIANDLQKNAIKVENNSYYSENNSNNYNNNNYYDNKSDVNTNGDKVIDNGYNGTEGDDIFDEEIIKQDFGTKMKIWSERETEFLQELRESDTPLAKLKPGDKKKLWQIRDKYKTLRRIRNGNTRKLMDQFENLY